MEQSSRAPTEKEISLTTQNLNVLTNEVGELNGIIGELERRLYPVLAPEPGVPAKEEGLRAVDSGRVVERIDQQANRITEARKRIGRLIARLEV